MLYKAIESGKEHRKNWQGYKSIDKTYRNHHKNCLANVNKINKLQRQIDREKILLNELEDFFN